MFLIGEGIFSSFNAQQLQEIRKSFIHKKYDRGESIFHEEDLTDGIYLILKGYVKVYQSSWNGREKTLAILSSGDIIGEMAAFGKPQRSASIKALEPTEVYHIPQRRFEELLYKVPAFGLKITEILSHRLRWANRQIALLVSGNSLEKVTGQLIYLAEKCGQPHNGGIIIRPREGLLNILCPSLPKCRFLLIRIPMTYSFLINPIFLHIDHPIPTFYSPIRPGLI